MAVNTNFQIPWVPQTGLTEQILAAIQTANEANYRQRQLALEQQNANTQAGQLDVARQKLPTETQEQMARAGYFGAEAQRAQLEMDQKRSTIAMFGGQPPQATATPAQAQPQSAPMTAPTGATQTTSPVAPITVPGEATQPAQPGASQPPAVTPQAGQPSMADFKGDTAGYLRALQSWQHSQELAKTKAAQPTDWLPSNTPAQLASWVRVMIPSDLSPTERNVVEAGAQSGRMEAMQTGNPAAFLTAVKQSVDSVVTNRNMASRNPENQPISDADRKNFLDNTLGSFENLTGAQKLAARGALANVKSQKDLQALEGRVMQQDSQGLQRKVAEENMRVSKEIAHGNALDMSGRNKIVADTGKWADAYTQIQLGNKTIDEAKNGDDLATRMLPTMEVLGVNMTGGIKRISPTEAEAAQLPTSWVNRFNQWVDAKTQGATSAEMVKEGKQLFHDLADARYGTYLTEAQSTAQNFALDPKGVYVMNNNGESVPLADALKKRPAGATAAVGNAPAATPKAASVPAGATHTAPGPDGKLHYTNADGTVDYGLVK